MISRMRVIYHRMIFEKNQYIRSRCAGRSVLVGKRHTFSAPATIPSRYLLPVVPHKVWHRCGQFLSGPPRASHTVIFPSYTRSSGDSGPSEGHLEPEVVGDGRGPKGERPATSSGPRNEQKYLSIFVLF